MENREVRRSRYALVAAVDSTLAVLGSSAACWCALRAGRGLDLAASMSTLYILVMYTFQSVFLEWPEAGFQKPQGYLLGSLANLLLPKLLVAKNFWAPISTRLLSTALSGGLAVAAYNQMVRGPSYTPPRLDGRVYLVTGANSGIGYEACKAFALAGATVIFGCRDAQRANAAMESIAKLPGVRGEQHFLPVDLASLKSVRRCAELLEESKLKVDVLVLNAGVMRRSREVTEDGFELTMAANHLGHFLLVQLLLPHLEKQEALGRKPRVVMVGSNLCYSHDSFDFSELVSVTSIDRARWMAKPYDLFRAYAQSKLANLMMVKELARQHPRIPVHCVHPGEVLTQVMNDMHPAVLAIYATFRFVAKRLFKSPEEGAVCTVFAATSPDIDCTGQYFMRLRPAAAPEVAEDELIVKRPGVG